jgi:23S rRNA pseudouridine2605 synthase
MLQRGIMLERKKTLPCEIKFIDAADKRNLNITISEGRNRQIRKMFEALGYFVNKLKRISYGNLRLGSLKKGEWRMLTQKEITELKNLKK